METVVRRVVGTARFDRESYLWVLWNERAGGDAALLVMITQLAISIGLVGLDVSLFLRSVVAGLFFWLLYAGITYGVGKFLLEGDGRFEGVLRIVGFAYPTRLLVLAFDQLDLPAALAVFLGSLWFFAVVAFGLKEALELRIERAWVAAVGGFLGYLVLSAVLGGLFSF